MKRELLPSGMLVLSLHRGEDLRFSLNPCTDDAGDPVDFSGSTFLSEVRTKDGVLVATATVTPNGLGRVDVVASDSYDWPAADHYFDIHETTSGGAQRWLLPRSVLRVLPSATVIP
jgi:hypothetical protein